MEQQAATAGMAERETAHGGTAAAGGDPSVVRAINQLHRRLEQVLFKLGDTQDASADILAIAEALRATVDRHPDIALACILLNQDEGSYAVRHCIDTAIVSLLVARALDRAPNEIATMMAAALTMNVGMLRHQEQLQNRLNAISVDERTAIESHPQQGVALLERAGVTDRDWLSYVLLHHENEDGSGYPHGRTGDDIPLNAKIISLADRYCARVSSRAYRKSLLPNEALSDILLADHQSVDPMLTACFIRVLGIYPTGAIVRLASGEIGVVVAKGGTTSTPVVQVVAGPNGAAADARNAAAVRRDTAVAGFAVREMLREDEVAIRFGMQQLWGDAAMP